MKIVVLGGAGRAERLAGADVVIDVLNAPSFARACAMSSM